MLAAARPLPSEETTPPVMKMYFGVRPSVFVISVSTRSLRRQQPPHLFQILGRVHFVRFVARFDRLDADAVLERAELLERLGLFQGGRIERRQDEQGAAAIGVETDMSIERGPAAPRVADVGDRRTG